MKISLDWLADFVTWSDGPEELAEKLTCLGLNVETIEEFKLSFPGVSVAKVIEVSPHPNADRLSVCSVHDGTETVTVVCGAPNVRPGLHVLLAKPGAMLPAIGKLKKTKIRGVESLGMICSASELELGGEADGIMELEGEPAIGLSADALFGCSDVVLDIEVTPNRPDWLCHLGVAREVAALHETKVNFPALWTVPKSRDDQFDWSVEIEDFADCPRYTLHAARNASIGPSPQFMQNRLRAVGAKPICNVVDITNYVLFELGQPLHAFDREKLSGSRIHVQRSGVKRSFATLDGESRELHADHLVIADSSGPIALAGVMGGQQSEVDPSTRDIMLESAFFDPVAIRQGARRLGLVTESSYRFERGADWDMVEKAAHRTLYLLQQHTGAQIVAGWTDRQNPDRSVRPSIPLRVSQVNRVLGTHLDDGETARFLQRLSLKVVPLGKASDRQSGVANLMVEVPSFRRDIEQEIDLVEEVARLYGFDNISGEGQFRGGPGVLRRDSDLAHDRIRRYLSSVGFVESVTSSFLDSEDLDRVGFAEDDIRRRCLAIANPHHGGDVLLRTCLLPSLLRLLEHNINAGNRLPLRFFQVNKVFLDRSDPPPDARHPDEKLLPAEPEILQIGLAGQDGKSTSGLPADLLELKGLLGCLSRLLAMTLTFEPADTESFLLTGGQWRLLDGAGQEIGWAGSLDGSVLERFGIEVPVATAEIVLDRFDWRPQQPVFRPFTRFPCVKRDLSLQVPRGVSFQRLEKVVQGSGGQLLENLELFDFYRGSELAKNTVVLGIRLKFRSDKGSLKGKTVDKAVQNIIQALADELDVHIRSMGGAREDGAGAEPSIDQGR